MSRLCKERLHVNNKKQAIFFKWTKDLNTHFSKKEVHMTSKQMKRCFSSLAIGEMQIQIAVSFPCYPQGVFSGCLLSLKGKLSQCLEPLLFCR